ncbi:MAG: hypothetical protein GY756_12865 [bacterium]|nr:hypothetical protein [bacterium]
MMLLNSIESPVHVFEGDDGSSISFKFVNDPLKTYKKLKTAFKISSTLLFSIIIAAMYPLWWEIADIIEISGTIKIFMYIHIGIIILAVLSLVFFVTCLIIRNKLEIHYTINFTQTDSRGFYSIKENAKKLYHDELGKRQLHIYPTAGQATTHRIGLVFDIIFSLENSILNKTRYHIGPPLFRYTSFDDAKKKMKDLYSQFNINEEFISIIADERLLLPKRKKFQEPQGWSILLSDFDNFLQYNNLNKVESPQYIELD